jgi:hypothetical protein
MEKLLCIKNYIQTFPNSVLEATFVHTTTTDIAKYVETIAESSWNNL